MKSQTPVKAGQRWRSKKSGRMMLVVSQRGESVHDDWLIRWVDSSSVRPCFGFSINRLYELVPEEEEKK